MSKIIDISPEIHKGLAVWPGDTPFSHEFLVSYEDGGHMDLSTIKTTVHLGAHTDAPNHYSAQGPGISSRDLNYYMGAAQVVTVHTREGERVQPSDVLQEIQAPRVLFSTSSYPDPSKFNKNFSSLSPELIDWLAAKSVKLVGIDTPSIDPFSSKSLESHKAVLRQDMAILEGVVLSDVSPGLYTLACLPLKIRAADASPVRAVLLPYEMAQFL